MRISCLECVCKHVGQAAVLMHEAEKGYPHHFIYAMGHLAEAEDEAAADYPELKERIYAMRKSYQKGEDVDIDLLIEDLYKMWVDLHD